MAIKSVHQAFSIGGQSGGDQGDLKGCAMSANGRPRRQGLRTYLVIAASAIAALVQLPGTCVAMLNRWTARAEFITRASVRNYESADFQTAAHFVMEEFKRALSRPGRYSATAGPYGSASVFESNGTPERSFPQYPPRSYRRRYRNWFTQYGIGRIRTLSG